MKVRLLEDFMSLPAGTIIRNATLGEDETYVGECERPDGLAIGVRIRLDMGEVVPDSAPLPDDR